jgi:phosphate/sulfate permease
MNYTKIGILLLRVSAVITIFESIPGIGVAIVAAFDLSQFGVTKIPNFLYSTILQPIVGVLLYYFSIPIAKRIGRIIDEQED